MYDNICKFLAENYSQDFARWLVGKPIQLTQLDPTELSVEPLRADSLILLQSEDLILHLEFQTQPDRDIPFRMADYRLRLYRRHPQKQVRQLVIYLKPTASPLVQQNVFSIANFRHEFEIIRMWEKPAAELLKVPGLLPLAVLCDRKNRLQILQQVAQTIEQLPEGREKSNLAAASSILAGLVLNKDVIQNLLREDMMRESVICQDWIARGMQQGLQQGQQQGEVALVLRQLKRRIGEIDADTEKQIQNMPVTQLEALGEALLDFKTNQDLTQWLVANP